MHANTRKMTFIPNEFESLANNSGRIQLTVCMYNTEMQLGFSQGYSTHRTRVGSWKESLSKHLHRSSAEVWNVFPNELVCNSPANANLSSANC